MYVMYVPRFIHLAAGHPLDGGESACIEVWGEIGTHATRMSDGEAAVIYGAAPRARTIIRHTQVSPESKVLHLGAKANVLYVHTYVGVLPK